MAVQAGGVNIMSQKFNTDGSPYVYTQEMADKMAELLFRGWYLVAGNIEDSNDIDSEVYRWLKSVRAALNQTPHEFG